MFREYRSTVRHFSPNARLYLTATLLLGVTSGSVTGTRIEP